MKTIAALIAVALLALLLACDENAPQHRENQQDKLAALMAANDITPTDIAQYLFARGWQIVPAALPRPHWRPAANGEFPVAYYVVEIRAAIGDTAFGHYFPQVAGPYRMAVKAVDNAGNSGAWSELGFSDNGDGSNALPGVRP